MERKYLTSAVFFSDNAKKNPVVLMIDSGSEKNILKLGVIRVSITRNNAIKFKGIGEGDVEAYGTADVKLRGMSSSKEFHQKFYMVDDTFQLEVDGLLGQDFLQDFDVSLNFKNSFTILNIENIKIPLPLFSFREALEIQKEYGKKCPIVGVSLTSNTSECENLEPLENFEPIMIPPLSLKIITITTHNIEPFFIPGKEITLNVFIASLIVLPVIGYVNVLLMNNNTEYVTLKNFFLPVLSLKKFFRIDPNYFNRRGNRIQTLNGTIDMNGYDELERISVLELISEFNKIFYLPKDIRFVEETDSNPIEEVEVNIINNKEQLQKFLDSNYTILISKRTEEEKRWVVVLDLVKSKCLIQECIIELTPRDKQYQILGHAQYISIFEIPQGSSDYTKWSKGLRPKTELSREETLSKALLGLPRHLSFIFFQKVIGISVSFNAHENLIRDIFKFCENNRIRLQLVNSKLFSKDILYLGHRVKGIIEPDFLIHHRIIHSNVPETLAHAKIFYSYCCYLKRFIPLFEKSSYALLRFINESNENEDPEYFEEFWNEHVDHSYYELQTKVRNIKPLIKYNSQRELILIIDIISDSIGVELCHGNVMELESIMYQTRILSVEEKLLRLSDQYLIGVHWALKLFKPLVTGKKCTLVTKIKLPWMNNDSAVPEDLLELKHEIDTHNLVLTIKPEQTEHLVYRIKHCETDLLLPPEEDKMKDAKAFGKTVRTIPLLKDRINLMRMYHVDAYGAHENSRRTINKLSSKYKWPGMSKDVESFVKNCRNCTERSNTPDTVYENPHDYDKSTVEYITVPIYYMRESK